MRRKRATASAADSLYTVPSILLRHFAIARSKDTAGGPSSCVRRHCDQI
jgi:hypothetical protein